MLFYNHTVELCTMVIEESAGIGHTQSSKQAAFSTRAKCYTDMYVVETIHQIAGCATACMLCAYITPDSFGERWKKIYTVVA